MSQGKGSNRDVGISRAVGGLRLTGYLAAAAVSIVTTIPSPVIAAMLDGSVTTHERPVKLDRHRLYSKLNVVCDVVFPLPGEWDVTIALSDREQYFGWLVPGTVFADTLRAGPSDRENGIGIGDLTTDSLGRARLAVQFDGNDLAHLPADGPWHFCISANSHDSSGNYNPKTSSSARIHAVTRAWRRNEFATMYSGELDHYDRFGWEMRSGEELVFTQGWDLLVAQVVRADTGGTRGRPPRLTLRVDEVLQGRKLLGKREAVWDPGPSGMWCGSDPNRPHWNATPYPAPAVGSRWILGGYPDSRTGLWWNIVQCRWPYSDSKLTSFRRAVHTWRPKIDNLRRLYEKGPGRELRARRLREAREKSVRDRVDHAKAAAAERERRIQVVQQTTVEKEWLARVRAVADSADIESLASLSDCIVVGRVELSGYTPHSGRSADALLRIDERLRWSASGDSAPSQVVRITPREDSVATLWRSQPPDTTPRGKPRPLRAIVFARRLASLRGPYNQMRTVLRLVDGETAIVLADAGTIARARRAAAASARSQLFSAQSPGTTWQDFAGLSPEQGAESAVKFSPLFPSVSRFRHVATLMLSSRADSTQPALAREWMWSRALPDSNYRTESGYSRTYAIRSVQMAAFLDSLTALAPIRSGRVEATDSLSVTLTRVRGGRVVQIERTLDSESVERVAWMLLRMKPSSPGPTPQVLDFETWVSAFRPSVFDRYARIVWEERYGKRSRTADTGATPTR